MIWWTKQQLRSKDAKSRQRAVEKLLASGGRDAVETIASVLSDEDVEVRRTAAALGEFREEFATGPLGEALRDPDETVRTAAAKSLGQSGGIPAVTLLITALQDPATKVRWQAARSLDELSWQPADGFQKATYLVAQSKLEMAALIGAEAIDPLALVLRTGAYQERHAAVLALSQIPDARVQKALIAALSDREDQVRCAAVEALRKLGDHSAATALISVLGDSHKHVRAAAAEALGQLNNPQALEPLRQILGDKNWEVRQAAAQALGRLRDAAALDAIIGLLGDREHEVRETAARALELIGERRAVTPLVIALKDENSNVRQRAITALNVLDPKWPQTEAARAAAPQLQEALRHNEYWVRQAAADALGRINYSQAAELRGLPATLPALSAPLHYRRQAAVEAFLSMLSDFDRELRAAAADSLGRLGQTATIPALTHATKDPDGEVRAFATRALTLLQNQAGTEGRIVRAGDVSPF